MGKKNKRPGSDPSTPAKRIKTSGSSSTSLPKIKYEDMPPSHKKKIFLHEDCGFLKKYTQLLSWIRTMGSLNGSTFEDICNLNCSEGYPLLEVEVVSPTEKSAKFIIYRETLYVIAFTVGDSWMQYKCEFEIEGFKMLHFDGKYTSKPWKQVGPKLIIDAIDCLNHPDVPVESHVESCAVFQVHFSEAARLYPIESLVCKSLSPASSGNKVLKRPYQEEFPFPSWNISDEKDVFSLVREGHVDYKLVRQVPSYVEKLIKNYSKMSKMWFLYSLTNKDVFDENEDLSEFHLRSKKSLRCTLAVLCNTNLEKLLFTWKRRRLLSDEVLDGIEREVKELQLIRRFLFPKNRENECVGKENYKFLVSVF